MSRRPETAKTDRIPAAHATSAVSALRTWQIVSGILIAVVAGCVLYVVPAFVGIQTDLATIQTELHHLRSTVEQGQVERWSRDEHDRYAHDLNRRLGELIRRIERLEHRQGVTP